MINPYQIIKFLDAPVRYSPDFQAVFTNGEVTTSWHTAAFFQIMQDNNKTLHQVDKAISRAESENARPQIHKEMRRIYNSFCTCE